MPDNFSWHDGFAPCFVELQAPHIEEYKLTFEDHVTSSTFPWQMFMVAPALSLLDFTRDNPDLETAGVLRSLATALRRGALQNLRRVSISDCIISDVEFMEFMETLVYSGCAERMVSLKLKYCGFGAEGMRSFADHLSQGTFPALKELNFSSLRFDMDVGVVALAEALNAPTLLTQLNLHLEDGRRRHHRIGIPYSSRPL